MQHLSTLKGVCQEIFDFRFFSMNQFPPERYRYRLRYPVIREEQGEGKAGVISWE
jgi:hypothetical protein